VPPPRPRVYAVAQEVAAATSPHPNMPLNEITPANESNLTRIRRAAGAVWQWLRGFTGDTAYEGYLRHASECSGKQLTAEEFYLDDIERKFTRPNRCC
jgi:hypothetical protein